MPGLFGPDGRLSMLCKGASAPDPPPPPPATPQTDEAGAAEMEKALQLRKKGMAQTQTGTLLESLAGHSDAMGTGSNQQFQIGKPNPVIKPKFPTSGSFRGGGPWADMVSAELRQRGEP